MPQGELSGDQLAGLERLHLIMGLQCNVRCTMCYQTDFSPRFNMGDTIWRDKLVAAYKHVKSVKLQGGEPTIMKNCRGAAMLLRDHPNARLSIITNGVFIDEFWHETFIVQGGNVSISINAATKETYDKIVIHGEWDRVIANIERVIAHRRGKAPWVGLTMVILKDNFHEIAALVELAGRLGVDYLEFLVDPILSFTGMPPRDAVAAELRRAAGAAQRWPSLTVTGLDAFGARLALPLLLGNPVSRREKLPMCGAPFGNLVVDWNGDVRVCCNTWVVIGNLYRASVEEIFEGPLGRRFRDKMKRGDYLWCSPQCTSNASPTRLALAHKYVYELRSDPQVFWKKVELKLEQVRGTVRAVRKRAGRLGEPDRHTKGARRSSPAAENKVRLPLVDDVTHPRQ